tara:strand:+ start:2335 stop:4806 length:2472 start_codon:yes stop_codon:yes gene_type:complete
MPNLVGIGNSQVPTNAMLGGLAYQDSVGEMNLQKINAVAENNAVDIFVYDTRKDSDGGAWRHRTQNTSWYNEGPSFYRGSRKEFPAVAVLVLEANYLRIYDGDDPDLSMWMVFNCNSDSLLRVPFTQCVAMLNAKLVVGDHNNYAGSTVDFIIDAKDDKRDLRQTPRFGNIAQRNETGLNHSNNSKLAVGQHTNDVAMTVLPNAPIDPDTGLPIPTIAVATDAGISIITHDQVEHSAGLPVIDGGTSGAESHQIDFMSPTRLVATAPLYYGVFEILYEDANYGYLSQFALSSAYYYHVNLAANNGTDWNNPRPIANLSTTSQVLATDERTVVAATASGLNIHQISKSSITDNNDGIAAYITSTYNTGYMVGDIKTASLSETDASDFVGNLVTNGTFDSNTTGWSSSGTATLSHQSGVARITGDSGAGSWTGGTIYQSMGSNFVIGKTYSVSYQVRSGGNTGNYSQTIGARIQKNANFHSNYTEFYRQTTSDPGSSFITISWTFTATVDTYGIQFYNYYGVQGHYLEYDDIVVKEAVASRSPTGRIENRTYDPGFVITGNINKQPVADGAELISYGGFATSGPTSHLSQQFNSDMNLSSGEFTIMAWIYPTGTSLGGIISRGCGDSYGPYGLNYSSQDVTFVSSSDWNESNDGGTWGTLIQTSGDFCKTYNWSQVVVTKSGSTAKVYINGIQRSQDTSAVNPKAPTSNFIPTMVGIERTGSTGNLVRPFPGRLALIRASNTAATEEQVFKMYNEEKQLFLKNAKCTLVGTSNQVNAIAHDDSTDIVHAGTSTGRSEFRGLERINSTTTAVSNAISASNGLVAEN